jgi:hypothetical protein
MLSPYQSHTAYAKVKVLGHIRLAVAPAWLATKQTRRPRLATPVQLGGLSTLRAKVHVLFVHLTARRSSLVLSSADATMAITGLSLILGQQHAQDPRLLQGISRSKSYLVIHKVKVIILMRVFSVCRRFLDPTTLVLTWDPPSDEGGRSDTQYKVECDVCSLHIAFSPQFPNSQTNVTLSHLQQGSTYNIKIFAINGVTNISQDTENYAEVSVSTGSGAPSVVSNLMISDQKPHQLSLSWLPPTDPLLEIDLYEVRYFVRGQKANMSNVLITKNEMIEISKLTEGTEYGLQVRARTNRGWGEFSSPLYAKTHSEVDPVFMGADKVC